MSTVELCTTVRVSAKGVRPSSAVTRPADADQLSAVTSHRQQNGSVDVGRQTTGGLGDSVGGLHRAALYVLGEKTHVKVSYLCCVIKF